MDTDLILILSAASFAAARHRDQRRKDAESSPYINHPLGLADILAREGGVTDARVIAAALLHDTVEDTETAIEELAERFGKRVAGIVAEVTDDKSLAKAERKRLQIAKASSKSHEAKLVKLADKIANLRDIANAPPADWSDTRKAEYFDWAKALVAGLRGTNASLEAAFDEAYARRPAAAPVIAELGASSKRASPGSSENPFSRSALTRRGFVGWATFEKLRNQDVCPDVGGVYVVVRLDSDEPTFLDQSCGGWFKDRDPTVTHDALRANWVSDAEVVYIGKANSIRRRLREFARFGAGQKIGHWGGRLIWQLADSDKLLVGWMPTPGRDPLAVECDLIAEFRSQYGKAPFANDPHRLGQ